MNELRNDKNLQEAVSRREQKLPPMPADLNERLMQRLEEPATASATKQKRLWLYAAVAVAASIALLIVFNFRQEQTPQKPMMAQAIDRTTPQPTPALAEPVEEQEPVVAEAQPAQKAVKRQRKVVVKLVELIPASEAESANDTDPFVAMAAQIEDIQQRGQCLQQEIDLLMEY